MLKRPFAFHAFICTPNFFHVALVGVEPTLNDF